MPDAFSGECTGPVVAAWLSEEGNTVYSVFDQARGMNDTDAIAKCLAENWFLVTNDKDFGEKVFRDRRFHRGVILLRLEDERTANKVAVLRRLLVGHGDRLTNSFVVVGETTVRFARRTGVGDNV
jgi:predicted nuclease of predicted toxin-antitoxin system